MIFFSQSARPLPRSTRTRARVSGRAHTHARKSVAAARSATLWGALRGSPLPPVVVGAGPASRLCCQTGRGLGLVQPPGQHLLDSFIQVTPELPGIFEAPSLPSPGTRGTANGLVTCSPESYGRALGNLYPNRGEEEGRGERGGRVGGGGSGGGGRRGGGAHKESRSPGGRVIPRTMCAERLGQFVTLALVFATLDPARGTDATNPPEGPQDRGSQQKGRLSLQNTGKRVRPAAGSCRGNVGGTPAALPVCLAPAQRPELTPGRANSWWLGTCRGTNEEKRGLGRAPSAQNPHVLVG